MESSAQERSLGRREGKFCMPHPRYTADEIVRRGKELYERDLRAKVEPYHQGQFLVLDIETGDCEIDADELLALERAIAKHPHGARYILRVGFPTAHQLGGRSMVGRP
jgi:predicted polyphosphate/ATP-dependent NAD kinase